MPLGSEAALWWHAQDLLLPWRQSCKESQIPFAVRYRGDYVRRYAGEVLAIGQE